MLQILHRSAENEMRGKGLAPEPRKRFSFCRWPLPADGNSYNQRMRVTVVLVAVLCAAVASSPAAGRLALEAPPLLAGARQMVLVVTPGWDDVRGELRRFDAAGPGSWQPAGGPVSIVVGRAGLAWDPAIERAIPGPVKREGD